MYLLYELGYFSFMATFLQISKNIIDLRALISTIIIYYILIKQLTENNVNIK